MGSPSRLRSIRTRCTCCRPGRAGESGLDRTHTHVRSSTSRTIRSASRRRGVHEADPDRTRIHARSLSNRNVCILSPSQFSFRKVVYQTNPPHAIPTPISIPDWKSATLELATLPHWQHFRTAWWGERTRLRALRVAFGNVPSEASPLRCMSSASRGLVFTSPMTSPLALLFQCRCVKSCCPC